MEASSHMTWEYYSYCGKSVVEHLQQVQDYLWSHSYLEICFLVISQQRLEGWGIWYNFHFNHQLTDVLVVIIVSPLRYCNNVYISYIHIYGTLYILGPIHTNLFSKRFASALIVFVSFLPVHTTMLIKREATLLRCPPFWIFTVEWSGTRPCLFWWRRCFQKAWFSLSTLENCVFKKHRFQITPLWRAFTNGSIFSDRFQHCRVDDSCIRSKTAPFSFENGLLWMGPYMYIHLKLNQLQLN